MTGLAGKLPFGVCQVGKAFRNEITPGNFTFRSEFEQMECEFFCKPRPPGRSSAAEPGPSTAAFFHIGPDRSYSLGLRGPAVSYAPV